MESRVSLTPLLLLLCAVCLSVWIQQSSAQEVAVEVVKGTVGEAVTFTSPVSTNLLACSWYKGTAVKNEQLICTVVLPNLSKQINGRQYTGREICLSDGSFVMRDLLTNYTGNYTVNASPNRALPEQAIKLLMVYGPQLRGILLRWHPTTKKALPVQRPIGCDLHDWAEYCRRGLASDVYRTYNCLLSLHLDMQSRSIHTGPMLLISEFRRLHSLRAIIPLSSWTQTHT